MHSKISEAIRLPQHVNVDLLRLHLDQASFGLPYCVVNETCIFRSFVLNGKSYLIRIECKGSVKTSPKQIIFSVRNQISESESNSIRRILTQNLPRLFGLNDPLQEIYRVFLSDSVLSKLTQRLSGLRLVQGWDIFETLFIVILGQQISVSAASAQRKRVVMALGHKFTEEHYCCYSLPTSEQLAEIPEIRLRELGISRQKCRYLKAAATWDADGKLDRGLFEELADAEAIDYLKGIPGVGQWTAEIVLARGLSRLDLFPVSDIGLQESVRNILNLDKRPSESELRDIAERWRGWRSYAALYLWSTYLIK